MYTWFYSNVLNASVWRLGALYYISFEPENSDKRIIRFIY